MTIRRMDNVAIVVDDLDAAVAFFLELGLHEQGRARIEGEVADHCVGLDGVRTDIVMVRTPDGHGQVELTKYHTPAAIPAAPPAPNTIGFHRIMFAVDDLDDVLTRLRAHGATLVGQVARYQDAYRLCYVRSREGFVVGLAESLNPAESLGG